MSDPNRRNARRMLLALIACIALSSCSVDAQRDQPPNVAESEQASVPVLRTEQHYFSLSNFSALAFNTPVAGDIIVPQPATTPPHSLRHPTASPTPSIAAFTSSFHIGHLAGALEAKLRALRNTELAVNGIQRLLDAAPNAHRYGGVANESAVVRVFAERLSAKLLLAAGVIDATAQVIEQLHASPGASVVVPCVVGATLDQHYDRTQIEIKHYETRSSGGESSSSSLNGSDQRVSEALHASFAAATEAGLAMRQAYILSGQNGGGALPCADRSATNARHLRSLLLAAVAAKNIMLIIDHGGSLNVEQLDLTRTFATHLVDVLNAEDRLAIVAVAGHTAAFYRTTTDRSPRLHAAHRDNRVRFTRFIQRLNGTSGQQHQHSSATNHTFAFGTAFALLRQIYASADAADAVPLQMIYVSRGLLSPLTEAKRVLQAIDEGQRKLGAPPVTIHTCAVVVDEKRIMYEKQFMREVARQNYTKYSIDASDWTAAKTVTAGRMLLVQQRDTVADMYRTVATLFVRPQPRGDHQKTSSAINSGLPRLVRDDAGIEADIVVPLTRAISNGSVVGVDMYLNDIAEDVAAFNRERGAYAFIVNADGVAVVHPSIGQRHSENAAPFYTDIRHLEEPQAGAQFEHVRQRLLVEESGEARVSIDERRSMQYVWQRATRQFVVCLVIVTPGPFTWRPSHSMTAAHSHRKASDDGARLSDVLMPELLFHRTDLLPPAAHSTMCTHFRHLTSMSATTLFLGAAAYKRPFVHLLNHRQQSVEQRRHNADSVMAYLKDRSTLLANPGLLDEVRADVMTVLDAMQLLRRRHLAGDGRHDEKYIVRRYVATVATGVLEMFPGCVLGYDLEVRERPWFGRAMAHPGRVVLTEPYLDAGGAGYIVTIAHTLHRNSHTNRPAAIVAVDVTLGFLYKLLLAAEPECGRAPAHIKCFLMDDAGFVLAHPNVLEPAAAAVMQRARRRRPLEHVTHVESYMANDILNWRQLVEKRRCDDYANRTRQRYYRFNTSLSEVLTNRVHGERTKYQLTAVAGTNVFVAWLNATGDGGAAFCPCSTLDRICLNCNRMEPTNCECPCECPLSVRDPDTNEADEPNVAAASTTSADDTQSHDICTPSSSAALPTGWSPSSSIADGMWSATAAASDVDAELLRTCSDFNCEQYGTQLDCLGVQGCEWCQMDVDAESYFAVAFCTQQAACFGGVLGAETPYGGAGDLGVTLGGDTTVPASYSVVGPVIGALIALGAVIGVAMYCYRQTIDGSADGLYNSAQETAPFGMPLTRFDCDDSSRPDDGGGMGGGGGLGDGDLGGSATMGGAGGASKVAMISPYRIAAGTYRAPAAHAESDHGYSTMTPREDSEHQCFALAEPLLRGAAGPCGGVGRPGRAGSSVSDSGSMGTSVSSPTNHNHCFGSPPSPPKTTAMHFDPSVTHLGAVGGRSPHHVQAKVTVHRPMEMI